MNINSYLTVSEVLDLEPLKAHSILGGHNGINNLCNLMVTLETPNGMDWLRGNEFVLTSGHAFVSVSQDIKERIIVDAKDRGAAAVCIKIGRFFGEISDKLVKDANYLGIPLITIPSSVNYTYVISCFYEKIYDKASSELLLKNRKYNDILSLYSKKLDVKELVGEFAKIIECDVNFLNKYEYQKSLSSRKVADDLKNIHAYYYDYPVIVSNELYGYLILKNYKELDNLQKECANYSLNIIKNVLFYKQLFLWNQSEFHRMLTELLLSNSKFESSFIENVTEILGWGENATCALYFKHSEKSNIRNSQIRRYLEQMLDKKFLFSNDKNNMVVFVNISVESIDSVLTELGNNFIYDGGIIAIGCSNEYTSIENLLDMYEESKMACIRGEGIRKYSLMKIEKIALKMLDDNSAGKFLDNTIGKLRNYDAKNKGQLIQTLKTYFDNNLSNRKTAEAMFIHVETLRYRLRRIESLTGYSLLSTDGIFTLKLAVELDKIIRAF